MANRADSKGAGSAIDKAGLAGNFRWGIDEQDEFSATLYALDNNNGMNYGLPWIKPTLAAARADTTLVPVDPNAYCGLASDYNKGSARYGMLGHTHRFSRDLELVSKVRYADYTRDQRVSLVRFGAAAAQPDNTAVSLATLSPSTVLTRSLQLKKQNMQTLTAQSDLSARFKGLGAAHTLQAGVDFANEKKQVFAACSAAQGGVVPAKPNTTIGTPYDGARIDEGLRSLRTSSGYTARAYGAYLQDRVQIAAVWKLLAGLRFDKLEGDYNINSPPDNAPSPVTVTPYTMNISAWSKRAAVLYQPSAQWSFHLMGATSFNSSGDACSLSAANQNIPPEQSVNVELGAKFDTADGKLSSHVGLFQATKLHERNTDPLINLVTLSGKRHAAGVDVDVVGRITAQWEVFGNFTWMPVALIDIGAPGADGQGTHPSLSPQYAGTVWTTYQLTPRLRMGAGLNGRSSQQPNRNPGFFAPKFVVADLMAEYAVVPDTLLLKLNVSNLSNKRYADALYTSFYVPGAGRLVSLTATYKF
jgi:catecholate siderophore receptor